MTEWTAQHEKTGDTYVSKDGNIVVEGQRHNHLKKALALAAKDGKDLHATAQMVQLLDFTTPLPDEEVEDLIRWTEENIIEALGLAPGLTDVQRAELVYTQIGDRILFDRTIGKSGGWWVYWRNYWQQGNDTMVQAVLRDWERDAKLSPQVQKDLQTQHKITSTINAMRAIALCEGDPFDPDPHYLAVVNGVVDLRTGELLPHDPKYLIPTIVPTPYNMDAENPTEWYATLDRILPNLEEQDFLQRMVGYMLTASSEEKHILAVIGPTDTGKTTIFKILQEVLGYQVVATMPRHMLDQNRNPDTNAATASDMHIRNARVALGVEIGQSNRLDAAKVKAYSGGDRMVGRGMYSSVSEWRNKTKLVLYGNQVPEVDNADDAFLRRLLLLRFRHAIPKPEQDRDHARRVVANEAEGILAWAVRGAILYYTHGLETPSSICNAAEQYVYDENPDLYWATEHLEHDEGGRVPLIDVTDDYDRFVGNEIRTQHHAMSRKLKKLGYQTQRFTVEGSKLTFLIDVKLKDT